MLVRGVGCFKESYTRRYGGYKISVVASEIEAKFKVANHRPIRRALRRAGGVYLGTILQTDRYFDTPKGDLLKRDSGLRIRNVRRLKSGRGEFDDAPLVTFKGPRKYQKGLKVRSEYQTRVGDADAIERIFHALDLSATLTIQKRRAEYRLGHVVVSLDTLPLLGEFVEIEAPSENSARRVCRRLNLDGEMITASYTQMLLRHCRQKGIKRRRFSLR